MAQKRWKGKSGYVTPSLTISKKELILYDLFLNPIYDNWEDWRDGMRDWFGDNKLIKKLNATMKQVYSENYEKRIRMNQKQKRLLLRRKVRKNILRGKK
ncbi:TPA: hypothetical protein HA242_02460 [Candidatus Woesearchaeota archaeon]|nr:hypothetical protein [Candidatus Woesearchaeota archaeon]HIG92882.1 hypothetical protein [Candidatus Woesearchaeota archaeon]HIH12562.1 hypothetical protein [Candidatus Woesearchaeota archaeon]